MRHDRHTVLQLDVEHAIAQVLVHIAYGSEGGGVRSLSSHRLREAVGRCQNTASVRHCRGQPYRRSGKSVAPQNADVGAPAQSTCCLAPLRPDQALCIPWLEACPMHGQPALPPHPLLILIGFLAFLLLPQSHSVTGAMHAWRANASPPGPSYPAAPPLMSTSFLAFFLAARGGASGAAGAGAARGAAREGGAAAAWTCLRPRAPGRSLADSSCAGGGGCIR